MIEPHPVCARHLREYAAGPWPEDLRAARAGERCHYCAVERMNASAPRVMADLAAMRPVTEESQR